MKKNKVDNPVCWCYVNCEKNNRVLRMPCMACPEDRFLKRTVNGREALYCFDDRCDLFNLVQKGEPFYALARWYAVRDLKKFIVNGRIAPRCDIRYSHTFDSFMSDTMELILVEGVKKS